MKTIVVTTDLSDESKVAFEPSRSLAKVFNAQIILLAVIEDPAQAAMVYALDLEVLPDPVVQKQILQRVRADLQDLSQRYFQDILCDVCAIEASSPTHREIINFAKSRSADLIVMATHGRTGLVHMLIGNITEKVVRESHCPVLTIPINRPSTR